MLRSLLLLSLLVIGSSALRSFVDPVVFASSYFDIPSQPQYKWNVSWYPNMPIDHFAYTDSRTFKLRYLINLDNYKPGGPIFFYTGNEGPIDGFANNTGLVWDLSLKFKAAVVFAEHRFYGETLPFGNNSYTSVSNLGYLSSEQALADYAVLIGYLKSTVIPNAANAPVIAFGGSYGGMLAAWFRIKYPHVVVGALSSSAPVLQFEGTGVDQGIFENIVKRTYSNSGCNVDNFQRAWTAINNLSNTTDGRAFLNQLFNLAPMSQLQQGSDGWGLIGFIREAIEYMAMVDYPYPSNFLKPLPGWPVKVACQSLSTVLSDYKELANAMYNVANLYYNATGTETSFCSPFINPQCSDAATSALSSPLGWPWQACTEMVMPICAQGPPNDLFWDDCNGNWTADEQYQGCAPTFAPLGYTRAMMRPDWIITNYGSNFAASSNIIFSNGALDPWSGGGVINSMTCDPQSQATGVCSLVITDSGHHLDLRHPNSCDPPSVRQARFIETNILFRWAYPNDPSCQSTTAPSVTTTTSSSPTCNFEMNGYPWGQTSTPSSTSTLSPTTTTVAMGSTSTLSPTTTTVSMGSTSTVASTTTTVSMGSTSTVASTTATVSTGSAKGAESPLLGLLLSVFFVLIIRF